jgi:signal transduction histidine kinase
MDFFLYTPDWGQSAARMQMTRRLKFTRWNHFRSCARVAAMLFIVTLLFLSPRTTTAAETAVMLETATYTVWNKPGLPDHSAQWQPVQLPFVSAYNGLQDPGRFPPDGIVWLRFLLDAPPDNEAVSLLFRRYNHSMTVFFNGEEIAANSQRAGRVTTAWNRPLLAHISSRQWQTQGNELLVKLSITPMGGNLAPPLLGPRSQLEEMYASRLFRQVEINRILLAFSMSISFFTFALWLMRRKDDVYLWFSMMSLAWGVATSHTVIYHNWLAPQQWLPLVHIAIDTCIFCMYGFIGRLARTRKPAREKLLLAWTLTAAVINLVLPPQWFWQVTYGMHLVGVIALALILLRVIHIAIGRRQIEAVIITLALMAQIALFLINAFQMFFSNGEAWDETLMFAHFGLPVLLLIFSVVLLRRFTEALDTAETLNRELEQKVEESRQIIERSFEQRRVLEMEQAAEKERLKIYRDLHDDVGSRLLSIIHADSDNKLGHMARLALESLRQAVSKANTPDQPLQRLLADIREETELRLTGSGHNVDWKQANLPEVVVPSAVAFNLNRIMKEVVSNIIRHADASEVQITVLRNQDQLLLTVTDNGRGFQPDTSAGNGLRNIHSRSTEIGAIVTTESDHRGTRFSLGIPLWQNTQVDSVLETGQISQGVK